MAIWKIPDNYKIDYSPNGDDVDAFSQKVKYCLEEAFKSLNSLHTTTQTLEKQIESLQPDSSHEGGTASEVSNQSISHLARLVENLYLMLDIAQLDPGGYDGLSGDTFYGNTNTVDTTSVTVARFGAGNVLYVGVNAALIEGNNYFLTDGTIYEPVQVAEIARVGTENKVTLRETVENPFEGGAAQLVRSHGTILEGAISGDGSVFTTKIFPFVDETTGAAISKSKAHVIVKHRNVKDAEINAEIALRPNATFVKGEVIGIGDGMTQTVSLANPEDLTRYKFALYFDGTSRTDFIFEPSTGEVTFTAPTGTIVTADYFYNWSNENFVEMEKTGTYPDRHNPSRATTEFTYVGTAGTVATIRLSLNQGTGYANNEVSAAGTGKAAGFKLAHKAIQGEIHVTPSSATVNYNSEQNVVIVTAPSGIAISVSYWWKGEAFSVDSFACMFDE